jgi:hypothetical protein
MTLLAPLLALRLVSENRHNRFEHVRVVHQKLRRYARFNSNFGNKPSY